MTQDSSDAEPAKSYGNISDTHWTRTRLETHGEALEYLRDRSKAPGVREGGSARNHYCMSCNGVIPLEYDSREAASQQAQHCPHCGVELDTRVRAMFNWVETDQVPSSDLAVLWPWLLGLLVLLVAAGWALMRWVF